jgi:hypothetical protein
MLGAAGGFRRIERAPADVEAAGLEEGEDHAAADDELVALGEERLDHANLGGHLRDARQRRSQMLRCAAIASRVCAAAADRFYGRVRLPHRPMSGARG